MADFPHDKAIQLSGTVGSSARVKEPALFGSPGKSPLAVFVSGHAPSDPGAMGLAEDIQLLIQAFIQSPASADRQRAQTSPATDEHGDIEIALHGLKLDPDREAELHRRIRELVRKRLTAGATKK
jgi:hypothetical protein